MTTDWINIISAVGFPIVLVLLGLNFFAKHLPSLLEEWRRFTIANEKFAAAVEKNTEITNKHYAEYITVEDHLKKAIALLEEHHANAVIIQEDMGELRNLFVELAEKIQSMPGGQ